MGKKAGILSWHLPSYLSRRRRGTGGGGLLSACKYPRTTSFAAGRGGDGRDLERAATLDDVNRFLCENFSSLYDGIVEDDGRTAEFEQECCSRAGEGSSAAPPKGNDDDDHRPCEIVLASPSSSQRFFTSSLVKSRSTRVVADPTMAMRTGPRGSDDYSSVSSTMMTASVSSASASSSSPDYENDIDPDAGGIPDNGVAVVTFSKDPQDDFLQSMEEMLDAHITSLDHRHRPPLVVDWDFMQNLLLCYLQLNGPSVHGHILQAFAHLVAKIRTRNDLLLCEDPPKADDEETDPTRGSDESGPALPVRGGAIFSYSP